MRNKLKNEDGALICEDCLDAEDPADDERKDGERMFRSVENGRDYTISHNDLHSKVNLALDSDKRFKTKTANNNVRSDFYLHDIHHLEDDSYLAIISNPAWNGKYFTVDFEFDGKEVALGQETEVEPKTTFEEVGRGLIDGRLIRAGKEPYGDVKYADPGYQKDGKKRYPINTKAHAKAAWSYINQKHNADKYTPEQLAKVKSAIKAACKHFGVDVSDGRAEEDVMIRHGDTVHDTLVIDARLPVDSKPLERNLPTMKTAKELQTEAPEAVNEIRADQEKVTRVAIVKEYADNNAKVIEFNKEVRALSNEFCKQHGAKWTGPAGDVKVVADEIRKIEAEICALDITHDAVERRKDFKRRADEIIINARPAKNQEAAADLPEELASRCSLRNLYNGAAKAQERGERTGAYMPKDGAEFEADKEIRKNMREFPGGTSIASEGVLMPSNLRGHHLRLSRGEIRRLTRDSLAGDFPSAGALISPEFKFPTIEILRNRMALGRAGIVILGGVMGNLVLPRQTGATLSQSLPEGAVLAEYDQVFDQIRMTPHRIGSMQKYSRLAMLQTTEDFEALVLTDHMAQNALRADYLVLNGSGANDEPLGLMNQPGIGVVSFGGSASAAYKSCVQLETSIRKANIDDEPTFITTSNARGTLRITPATLTGSTVVSGETNALWDGDELIGRPAVDSQQVPNDSLVCLVGRHVVMAQWGGWMVVLDTISVADQDKIKLSINTYIDAALRHPQAVARSADSLASLT